MGRQERIKLMTILALCFVCAHSALQLTLVCQTASTSICSSGYQYVVSGTGLSTKYCLQSGQTCAVGSSTNNALQITNCTNDYKNSPCTTKLCYSATAASSYCSPDYQTCNSTANVYGYKCDTCASISNCQGCFQAYKDTVKAGAETCFGTCSSFTNVTTNVQQCTNDALGFTCTCCINNNVAAKVCTSVNPALSTADVTNWGLGISNSSNSSGNNNFASHLVLALYTFALLFAFIY